MEERGPCRKLPGAPTSHPPGPDCRLRTEKLKLGGRGKKVFTEVRVLGAACRPLPRPPCGVRAVRLGTHACPDPRSLLPAPWASCPDLPKLP